MSVVEIEDGVFESTAVIDNGSFGTRTIRFETGRLAKQAAGSVVAYLDDETMLLSSVGGILGVLLGICIPFVVSHFSEIETVVQWWTVLLAFGISVGIGVVFGIYPARRAALMDPIEALRHE